MAGATQLVFIALQNLGPSSVHEIAVFLPVLREREIRNAVHVLIKRNQATVDREGRAALMEGQ